MNLEERIEVARGEKRADLVLKNAQLVNVFSGDIYQTSIAIHKGVIVGFNGYRGKKVIDLRGDYVSSGFIDGHIHLESTKLHPQEFAQTVVPLGTTAVVADPHEIANVMGLSGIKFLLDASENIPLDIYFMLPSCVPATNLETSGAHLYASDLSLLINQKRVLGLAEVMNYSTLINLKREMLEEIRLFRDKVIDGHCPGLSGKDLCAYVNAGVGSDHECSTLEEAREKLRLGMHIMIREGSTEKNLKALLSLVNPGNSRRCFFVSDDRSPLDLLKEGHMNFLIKKSIKEGLEPVLAIQMATLNVAEYFRLKFLGGLAPGYLADLVVFNNFRDFKIKKVFKRGKLVAQNGKILPLEEKPVDLPLRSSMNINWRKLKDFKIPAKRQRAKIIEIVPNQIFTRKGSGFPKVKNGVVVSDIKNDILKLVVIERHHFSGKVGLGLVKGFHLKKGAIGSTVAHDSHNLIIVGTNDQDMMVAARELEHSQGGQIVVSEGKVKAILPLPIAGLISNKSFKVVSREEKACLEAAQALGCSQPHPFMTLSFLALPVIPELKLTDMGLVDVNQFKIVSLWEK